MDMHERMQVADHAHTHPLLQLVQLGCSAHLLDPAFTLLCSQFYITYCVWITMQFEACRQVSAAHAGGDAAVQGQVSCAVL